MGGGRGLLCGAAQAGLWLRGAGGLYVVESGPTARRETSAHGEPPDVDLQARRAHSTVMKNVIITSVLLIIAQVENAAATPRPELNEITRAAICALSADVHWHPFGNVQPVEDRTERERLTNSASPSEFFALPPKITCPSGRRSLHKRGKSLPFSAFWIAKDQNRAAISVGFVGGELLGSGGTCYYKRSGSGWKREGCVEEWAI